MIRDAPEFLSGTNSPVEISTLAVNSFAGGEIPIVPTGFNDFLLSNLLIHVTDKKDDQLIDGDTALAANGCVWLVSKLKIAFLYLNDGA